MNEHARFLKQAELSADDCWMWKGPTNVNPQRESFRLFRKHEFDSSRPVVGRCGNDLCVRVSHLTQTMNENDKEKLTKEAACHEEKK